MPFAVTIVAALLFSAYMLLDPGAGLSKFMQLTEMPVDFKVFILGLALGGLACAWVAERYLFLWLARHIGKIHDHIWPRHLKQRKQYKILLDQMRT